ncbi:MAG TPA: hypothetical protein VFP72_04555 [Kineosporiaceae bacterium]|nr:hypothetical protein [Kineosporiaceae bacterium]
MAASVVMTVTRPLAGGGDLVLPSGGIEFGHVTDSGVQWDRQFATSPFVDGRALTSARRQTKTLVFGLIVSGVDAAGLAAAQATVDAAFSQFAYQLRVSAGGSLLAWNCEPADFEPAEVECTRGMRDHWLGWKATIPCSPA